MTVQAAEVLMYRGEKLHMHTTPLEFMPRERRCNFMPSGNTALWRGYVCLWEIRDDRLYLADIHGSICTASPDATAQAKTCGGRHRGRCEVRQARVSDFSGGADGLAFADWCSAELKIPQGKLISYVHMGFASQYERYLILTIVQGRLEGERVVAGATPPPRQSRLRRLIGRRR